MSDDDDEPSELRDFPPDKGGAVVVVENGRVIVASTPLGSSSFFEGLLKRDVIAQNMIEHRIQEQLPSSANRHTKSVREWREQGCPFPEDMPAELRLTGEYDPATGRTTFVSTLLGGWVNDEGSPMSFATVDRTPDAELRERAAALLFKDPEPEGIAWRSSYSIEGIPLGAKPAIPPVLDVEWPPAEEWPKWNKLSGVLDDYMTRLAQAVQIPASMLMGSSSSAHERRDPDPWLSSEDWRRGREVDSNKERYLRIIGAKQFRMRARMWLTLRGPLHRYARGAS